MHVLLSPPTSAKHVSGRRISSRPIVGLLPVLAMAALAPSFVGPAAAQETGAADRAGTADRVAATGERTLPRAEANDQRTPAGRLVDGVLRVELEAVESAWYPRGPDGPRVVTPAFAEAGAEPRVPGPLIRVSAGTPVHVTLRNALARPIAVRGLVDRASTASEAPPPDAGPLPAFAFSEPVVIPPGETRETEFTPTAEVSSFYYAQRLPPGAGADAVRPFGTVEEGGFMGALVVDAAGAAPVANERVLMITRWGSRDEPGMDVSWKMMQNGRSWPFTERLTYTVGDTARWRVINASLVDHPMHLHGFFFTVDAAGDTQADTTYEAGARPRAVTHTMQEFSSLRLTWVPEEPGNWLFHCHLVRHMGEVQRFEAERAADPSGSTRPERPMDTMAGLVTGITVHPAPGTEPVEEAPARRIHLWTGERPDVYDGEPELAFVVQEGVTPPPSDSTQVPGSPLVLTRGEPTEIVVHNRFDFPVSVHWHGLELRSLYDGVGGWSGEPGATRPPIAPGDSTRVHITPRRAGSFMYHTHGEAGHELSQGLYGPFLVLEPGESRDPDADRIFVLGARGATRDATPAVNGRAWPEPERFVPGRTYRLRFLHISPDAFKRVRLLRNGESVRWRPLARDGADLPESARELGPATLGLGVGEAYDVTWTPEESGVHVLEVTTEFYPARGGTVTQRIAFGVGEVSDADLVLRRDENPSRATLSADERTRYTGTFVGRPSGDDPDPLELLFRVWEEGERLLTTGVLLREGDGEDDEGGEGRREQLFPLGDHAFASGRNLDGLIHASDLQYRFVPEGEALDRVEVEVDGNVVLTLERAP